MEEKITVRVPLIDYTNLDWVDWDGSQTDYAITTYWWDRAGVSGDNLYAFRSMGGAAALGMNIYQFLDGSPVVDYSSFRWNFAPLATAGAGSIKFGFIDTTRSYANYSLSDHTSSTTVSDWRDTLRQNRAGSEKSVISEDASFVFVFDLGGLSGSIRDEDNNYLRDSSGTVIDIVDHFGTPLDVHDDAGNFLFCIYYEGSVGTGANLTLRAFHFDIKANDGDSANNWNTHAASTAYQGSILNNIDTGGLTFQPITYDGKRIDVDSTDTLADMDLQGFAMLTRSNSLIFYPMSRIDGTFSTAVNPTYNPEGLGLSEQAVTTAFPAGRYWVSGDDRYCDTFTIIRGPGYFRIFGQVSDPSDRTQFIDEERETTCFVGMFPTPLTAEEYPHPMAFLANAAFDGTGDQATLDAVPRPWFRTPNGTMSTADSSAYELNNFASGTQNYVAIAPFILKPSFRMYHVTSDYTLCNAGHVLLPYGAYSTGYQDWPVLDGTSGHGGTSVSYLTDLGTSSGVFFSCEFFDQGQEWTDHIGTNDANSYAVKRMTSPSGPVLRPITLTAQSSYSLGWARMYQTELYSFPWAEKITSSYDDGHQIFGHLPGISWTPEIESYSGATVNYAASGQEITDEFGRTHRIVVGYVDNASNSAYREPIHGYQSSSDAAASGVAGGNLMFCLDAL